MKLAPFITVAVVVSMFPCFAADISLSGTVTDLSGHVLSGAGVALVGVGRSTTTNTSGDWHLSDDLTGIVIKSKSGAGSATRHLILDGKRIQVRFEGMDAVGRSSSGMGGLGDRSLKPAGTVVAARSVKYYADTLLYSWNGQVLARVGISSLLAGDVGSEAIDTISYDSLSYGGQTYKTVTIGTQTWMAENLNYKVDSSWCYGNSADSCSKYGLLYTWAAVMNFPDSCNRFSCGGLVPSKHQGICPTDWHVPSDSEWTVLAKYVGVVAAGAKLNSSGWSLEGVSGNGTDVYGFRTLPAGDRYGDGSFGNVGSYAGFWSSSESFADHAWSRYRRSDNVDLVRLNNGKVDGCSVRCLKD